MKHQENRWVGNPYRQEYLDGINRLIENMRKNADKARINKHRDILSNDDKYRREFKNMLGFPLNTEFDVNDIPSVKKELVAKEETFSIYRMQIEIMPELWFYGLYFEHNDGKKRPFVICQHGGAGTCEICSSFFNSSNYNDMVQRVLKYDVNVFAPQLLLWQSNVYGINYDRREIDISLKQLGSSITALEIYGIMKSINYFSTLDTTDTDKIGMVGLSYGGFYTLFTTACETRIKAAYSTCFYNNRYTHNWSDWMWDGSANKFFDNEIALLVYPRTLYVAVGENDASFKVDAAKEEFEILKKSVPEIENNMKFITFEGVHEFPPQEEYLKEWMADFLN